jgi:hypothetical protein
LADKVFCLAPAVSGELAGDLSGKRKSVGQGDAGDGPAPARSLSVKYR